MSWRERVSGDPIDRDYPDAKGFIQVNNYKIAPVGTRTIDAIVIHITGGPATTESSAVNHFLDENANASAHYIVNRQGEVLQMIRDKDIAFHAGSSANRNSIGIEHVNRWNIDNKEYPTDEQYKASAKLVAWLCKQYGVPIEHVPTPTGRGIKGHVEADPSTGHTNCPNVAWDWNRYIQLVQEASQEPVERIEWECWLRKPTHASQVKLIRGGIIGVFPTEIEADQEKEVDEPWDQPWGWECWLRRATRAIRVKLYDSGIIGVFQSQEEAEIEKDPGLGQVWKKVYQ